MRPISKCVSLVGFLELLSSQFRHCFRLPRGNGLPWLKSVRSHIPSESGKTVQSEYACAWATNRKVCWHAASQSKRRIHSMSESKRKTSYSARVHHIVSRDSQYYFMTGPRRACNFFYKFSPRSTTSKDKCIFSSTFCVPFGISFRRLEINFIFIIYWTYSSVSVFIHTLPQPPHPESSNLIFTFTPRIQRRFPGTV